MAISVKYYQTHYNISSTLTDYIIKRIIYENQQIINKVIDNLDNEKYLLLHLKRSQPPIYYEDELKVFEEIKTNDKIIENIKKNIYLKGILKDFSDISKLNKNDPQYDYLKDKIINVNEYNII